MAVAISVVMTVYNRECYLAQAIESVLNQSWPDFELILWDDGSSDRSVEIARTYAERDRRIRFVAAEHRGRGSALDAATQLVRGEFLGFVDSDDLLCPTSLAQTAVMLENFPEVGMVYTNHNVMDAEGRDLGLGKRCEMPYSKEKLLLDFMTFHFRLMRTSVFRQVGGINPKFNAAQDYDLCLRLSEVTEIRHVPKSLYRYRVHRHSISQARQLEQIRCSYEAILQALKRRGLADRLELRLELRPRYILQPKQSSRTAIATDPH
ncbi:glycosyltransferase [Synechococcus sp. PCC 7336]|uniref:glycosyltransferase n=1 Tax=Synechococcus sp. PCC 7336 TaxID=195250 RepID=UPI00047768CD|nr:glycosyltransferase [Synechococcus sp. PCC 7336]